MAKLIIAIDIPTTGKDLSPTGKIIVSKANIRPYEDFNLLQVQKLKPGTMICFDDVYLERDEYDDGFVVAEFRGIEVDHEK